MIKISDNECSINGNKTDVMAELQVLTEYILEELDTIDKYIFLHTITDIINASIKENRNRRD